MRFVLMLVCVWSVHNLFAASPELTAVLSQFSQGEVQARHEENANRLSKEGVDVQGGNQTAHRDNNTNEGITPEQLDLALARAFAFHRGMEIESSGKWDQKKNLHSRCILTPKMESFKKLQANLIKLIGVIVQGKEGEKEAILKKALDEFEKEGNGGLVIVDKVEYGFLHAGLLAGKNGVFCVNLSGKRYGYVQMSELFPEEIDNVLYLNREKDIGLELSGLTMSGKELQSYLMSIKESRKRSSPLKTKEQK